MPVFKHCFRVALVSSIIFSGGLLEASDTSQNCPPPCNRSFSVSTSPPQGNRCPSIMPQPPSGCNAPAKQATTTPQNNSAQNCDSNTNQDDNQPPPCTAQANQITTTPQNNGPQNCGSNVKQEDKKKPACNAPAKPSATAPKDSKAKDCASNAKKDDKKKPGCDAKDEKSSDPCKKKDDKSSDPCKKDDTAPAAPEIDYNKAYWSGDWGGWRPWLVKKGITITSSFVTDILSNPVGGLRRGIAHADSFGLNFDFDLEKLWGAKGLDFFVSFVVRDGSSLSLTIGNQFPVAQVFGGETYRLNELYLKESLFDDHFHFKFGRIDGGNDFFQSPLYYNFVSNAFDGNPIGIFFNIPFTAYPNSTWGAYVDATVEKFRVKAAIYVPNRAVVDNPNHGFNWSFHSNDGLLYITEWGYLFNQDPKDTGLPGNYRIGAYYLTGREPNLLPGFTRGNYGGFMLFDQMLYREGKPGTPQGLTAFAALLFAPQNRNLFPFFMDCGLIYQGLSSCRPLDKLCFGVAYGEYSSDVREAERIARDQGVSGMYGNVPQTAETVLELNYWYQVNDWFVITPDIQYIINPRGLGTIPNALVVGAQIGFTF